MQRLFISLTIFIVTFFPFSDCAGRTVVAPEDPDRHQTRYDPIRDGERVLYQASWNGIPIAKAKIHSTSVWRSGKKFYQVRIRAKTYKYLDLIWKMRDSIESTFEADTLSPHRFVFRQRENRKRVDTTALYDHGSKKWVVLRQKGHKVRQYEFQSSSALDPILATYYFRTIDFDVGDELRSEVLGGKSRYLVILKVVGKEQIQVKAGNFDAYKIIPRVINLTRLGYAKRMRHATVWVSADINRRVLKVASQVFVGSIYIELLRAME